MGTPSNEEQLALELINRFRLDPDGEYARLMALADAQANVANAISYFGVTLSALQSQLAALSPAAPLAWSSALNEAATLHSQAMIGADQQSHQLPGEPGLGARITNAGYQNLQAAGENIYAFSDDTAFGHAGFVIDWGHDAVDFNGDVLHADWRTRGDGIQDGAGHRVNMMNPLYTEVGIGILQETDAATEAGEFVTTQDFATSFGYQPQFVGVVIDDEDGDAFYDVGEGLGGVTITLAGGGSSYQTTSWSSGGWQIEVPAGNYTITFSGGGLIAPIVEQATLGGANVKVDAIQGEDAAGPAAPTNGDDVLAGTAGADAIDALAGNDAVSGLAGDDLLTGGAGADMLDGGAGADTASFMGGNGVTVSLLAGSAQFGHAHGDALAGIENLSGSAFFDELTGDAGANLLSGAGGDDFLNGSGGNDGLNGGDGDDDLWGGAGADALDGGAGADTASYATSGAAVEVNLATGVNAGGHAQGDTLANVEAVTGSAFADTLTGGTGAEAFNGGQGDDRLVGSAGGDRLNGNQGVDTADYSGSAAGVGVNLLTTAGAGGAAAGDMILNVENLIGSAFADVLTGTTGANLLSGGGGADSFNASLGDDRLDGGAGDDVMVGGSGADAFDGGAGSDWVYYSNAAAVDVSLAASGGAGSHAAGDSFVSVENLFGSVAADTLTGEGGANTLNGFHGHDTLNGLGGGDVLLGGTGDDWLNGGPGDDVLSGYLGADTLVYNLAGFGADTIIGFEDGVDRIDLNAGLTFADFTETAAGPGTLLTLTADPASSILILGTPPADIDPADFI